MTTVEQAATPEAVLASAHQPAPAILDVGAEGLVSRLRVKDL